MSTCTSFRARLQRGDQTLGVLLSLSVGALAEMSAVAGMDFIFIDCEHGPVDYPLLEHGITAAELRGTNVFVRVGLDEPALVQRVLDMGATGVVFPHIDTVEEAQAAVRWSRYPPLGNRGFSNYGRTGGFGRVRAADHVQDQDTIVIVMIESKAGYDALRDILAVPGVDGVMCGPADLAISAGVCDVDNTGVRAMVTGIHDQVGKAEKFEIAVVGTKHDALQCLSNGVHMVAINLAPVIMGLLADWRGLAGSVSQTSTPAARG